MLQDESICTNTDHAAGASMSGDVDKKFTINN